MKKIAYIMVAIIITQLYCLADDKWLTDFKKAIEISKTNNLPVLVKFSGSDWCGWCMKLEKEVFDTKEFKEWAGTNLVLFIADFPRSKQLSEKVREQNEALLKKYGVRGFPTILLLDQQANVIGQTGYRPGGASRYIEHLKQLLDRKTLQQNKGN